MVLRAGLRLLSIHQFGQLWSKCNITFSKTFLPLVKLFKDGSRYWCVMYIERAIGTRQPGLFTKKVTKTQGVRRSQRLRQLAGRAEGPLRHQRVLRQRRRPQDLESNLCRRRRLRPAVHRLADRLHVRLQGRIPASRE